MIVYGGSTSFSFFSAGVGRTGTFIVVDYAIQESAATKSVNIFNIVAEMRRCRPLMVQTGVIERRVLSDLGSGLFYCVGAVHFLPHCDFGALALRQCQCAGREAEIFSQVTEDS